MTRCWTVSCFVSLLLLSPAALAESGQNSADKPSASPNAAAKGDGDQAQASDEKKGTDDAKAGAPAATAGASTAAAGGDAKKKKMANDETAVLGAAAPTPPPSPYQLFFTLGLQVGIGTFVPDANRELVGYSLSLAGLYRLSKLFDGRLDVFAVMNADQALTQSSQTDLGSVGTNEFFFRDVRVGLLGRSLLNDKEVTGIIIGANTSIDLPTGLQAQAVGRFLRWNLNVNFARMIREVGPGNLLVRLGLGGRIDFGEGNPGNTTTSALCTTRSQNERGECLAGNNGVVGGFTPSLSLTYFIGDFNIGIGFTMLNVWFPSASGSEFDTLEATGNTGQPVDVTQSQNGQNETNYLLITSANVSVTYVVSRYLNFTLGLSTFQQPLQKCDQARDDLNDTGQCARFPFFDFTTPTDNLTSVFFNTTIMY